MSFLAEGTPINKDTIDEAVETIALACALGVRQHAAIVRLIETGKLEAHQVPIPGRPGASAMSYEGGLSAASWRGIEKRLKKAGFSVKKEWKDNPTIHREIRLYWGTAPKEKTS